MQFSIIRKVYRKIKGCNATLYQIRVVMLHKTPNVEGNDLI